MRNHHDDPDLELALRRSLQDRSRSAPAAGPLAERILATVERPVVAFAPQPRAHPWRAWGLPLLAAGAAAAVVGAGAAVQHYYTDANGVPSIASPTAPATAPDPSAPAASSSAFASAPSGPSAAAATSPAAPTRASTRSASTAPTRAVAGAAALPNLRLLDVTFDGADDGWALASSTCLTGSDRCTALLRTTDGTTWTSVAGTPFNVVGVNGCAAPCVQHLRFATSKIGYAFGPQALFLTTDGARTWQRQPGGAEALETLGGNVIRVVSNGSGCPGPCRVRVELSAIGASTWTTVHLVPGDLGVTGLAFARGGSAAYLLAERNPADGASNTTSTLYASTDDGASWHAEGEPCPQAAGREADSVDLAAASGTRLTVLCTERSGSNPRTFVVTSSDGGRTTIGATGSVPVPAWRLAGDAHTVLAAGGNDGLAVSRDGGTTWTRISNVSGTTTFVGFESATIGRVIADNGRSLWTTRDGGRTWARATFR